MKKILSVLLALTCLLGLLVACKPTEHDPASGEKPSKYSKGLDYEVNGNYCTITGIGKCKDTEIYIPEEIGGKKVYVIGAKAFEGNTNVTKIWLPDTVDQIERRAFKDCTNLKVINIPENVTEIGDQILDGCVLDEFYYYTTSEYMTYMDMPAAKKIVYGKESARGCFRDNETVEEVILLDSVRVISANAFLDCKNLKSIVLPDSITYIGEWAFSGCDSLTSIIIPDSMETIGELAFGGMGGLISVTIPDSIKRIEREAFFLCENLTNIVFMGTMEQWKTISKWHHYNGVGEWNDGLPATVVHCTDGDVPIN